MYQVSSSTLFSFVSIHAHTCPLYNVLLEVVCCCFLRNELFINMMLFIGSQSFISLPSVMFVNATVSEIRKLNQNKEKEKEKKNSVSTLRPFLHGHIIYPFFNQRYLLSTCTAFIC